MFEFIDSKDLRSKILNNMAENVKTNIVNYSEIPNSKYLIYLTLISIQSLNLIRINVKNINFSNQTKYITYKIKNLTGINKLSGFSQYIFDSKKKKKKDSVSTVDQKDLKKLFLSNFDEIDKVFTNFSSSNGVYGIWNVCSDTLSKKNKVWSICDTIDDSMHGKANAKNQYFFENVDSQTTRSYNAWCVSMTEDRAYLAAGTNFGYIFVWKLGNPILDYEKLNDETFNLKRFTAQENNILQRFVILSGHTGGVINLQWSGRHNNRILISCGFDCSVRLWSIQSPSTLCILKCPSLPIGVAFTSLDSSNKAIISCLDGSTRLISFNPSPNSIVTIRSSIQVIAPSVNIDPPPIVSCKVLYTTKIDMTFTHMSVNYTRNLVAIGTQYGIVQINDLHTGKNIRNIHCRNSKGKNANGQKVTGISWNSDGTFIAVSTEDGRIRIVCVDKPTNYIKLKAPFKPRLKAMFDVRDKYLFSPAIDGNVYIWDLEVAINQTHIRNRNKNQIFDKNHIIKWISCYRNDKPNSILHELNYNSIDLINFSKIATSTPKNTLEENVYENDMCESKYNSGKTSCTNLRKNANYNTPMIHNPNTKSTNLVKLGNCVLMDLPPGLKRTTALPVASFNVSNDNIISFGLTGSILSNHNCKNVISLILGTNSNKIHVCIAIIK